MISINSKALSSALLAALALSPAKAGPYVISDDRVRSLDVSPTLGRGYSIMTNSFQSVCMNSEELTIPSFNYDCEFLLSTTVGQVHLSVPSASELELPC